MAEVVIIVCLPMIVALMALTFVIVMSSLGDVQTRPEAQRPLSHGE